MRSLLYGNGCTAASRRPSREHIPLVVTWSMHTTLARRNSGAGQCPIGTPTWWFRVPRDQEPCMPQRRWRPRTATWRRGPRWPTSFARSWCEVGGPFGWHHPPPVRTRGSMQLVGSVDARLRIGLPTPQTNISLGRGLGGGGGCCAQPWGFYKPPIRSIGHRSHHVPLAPPRAVASCLSRPRPFCCVLPTSRTAG